MRTVLFALASFLAAGLIDIAPAQARWSCVGPEFVCGGSAKSSGTRMSRTNRSYQKRAYRERRASRRAAKVRRGNVARNSYDRPKARTASRRSTKRTARASAPAATRGGSGQTGIASYYWQPQAVASGGRFNPNALTAAHKTLPFGTRVRVTHLGSGKSVEVKINDRGPFVRGRVIDLSRAAAGVIGMRGAGLARVRVDVLGRG